MCLCVYFFEDSAKNCSIARFLTLYIFIPTSLVHTYSDRLQDSRAYYSRETGSLGCLLRINISVQVSHPKRPNVVCSGQSFTYAFPITVTQTSEPFPLKLPRDYTEVIVGATLGALGLCFCLCIVHRYQERRRVLIERRHDQMVQRMQAYINSKHLDPRIRRVLFKAKMRILYGRVRPLLLVSPHLSVRVLK
jgi:hypothetical protein